MNEFILHQNPNKYDVIQSENANNINIADPRLMVSHELPSLMQFNKNNLPNFKFKEFPSMHEQQQPQPSKMMENIEAFNDIQMPPDNVDPYKPFYLNKNMRNKDTLPNINFDFIPQALKDSGNIQYLGSSIGSPFEGFNSNTVENKVNDLIKERRNNRQKNKKMNEEESNLNKEEVSKTVMNKKKKSSTFSNNLFIEKTTNVKDKKQRKYKECSEH